MEVRTKTARTMMMMIEMMFGALPLLYLTAAIGGGESEETGHQRQTKTLTQDDLTVDDSADRKR